VTSMSVDRAPRLRSPGVYLALGLLLSLCLAHSYCWTVAVIALLKPWLGFSGVRLFRNSEQPGRFQ